MRRYILTGAPGVGKTAVLAVLAARGYAVVPEAATDINLELLGTGIVEPWRQDDFLELIVRRQQERAAAPRTTAASTTFRVGHTLGMTASVRRVGPDDVPAVVALVHELADYEHAADQCLLTEPQLQAALFGDHVALFGHVADVDGVVVGCALWFLNFSTWRGVHGIYLEDLYVQPAERGRGLGRLLLAELARECERQGYARLEWMVLDWNEPSIGFYRSLDAVALEDWIGFRLTGDALRAVAT